jgi:hypothetical protein
LAYWARWRIDRQAACGSAIEIIPQFTRKTREEATAVTELFEMLQDALDTRGPSAAIDKLCAALAEQKDFTGLFYALLMKKRQELGVSPIPTGPAAALPTEVHAEYEDAIRAAANVVGKLCLGAGNIPAAWMFYRMLSEPEPVRQALDRAVVVEGQDCQALIDIAYHQGVHPKKGFDLVLERLGICNAITLVGGHDFPHGPDVRDYCIKRLVRALHAELVERLSSEIEHVENLRPTSHAIQELLAGRDWLFADDLYHIDVSHLGAVVQMSIHLPSCLELNLARELCVYGQRLSPRCQFGSDPPFENQYRDYGVYLAILAGDNVEEGLAAFRAKVQSEGSEEIGTYPAEVFVNLLLKIGRHEEALAIARRHLMAADSRQLTCPGIVELCEKASDFKTLAEVAREQNNAVHYLAALLASRQS